MRKSQYERHLLTRKHSLLTNTYIKGSESSKPLICLCGKKYKHRQSLYNHRLICKNNNDIDTNEIITKELVMKLIKQNHDLQTMLHEQHNKMCEIIKDGKTISTNVTNNHTTNNNFNLNVFLNEKCKDAINLMDFVDSLKIKMKDLEYTARLGYAEGISQIFINGLSELDVHKRPIHCSDFKREILYIKEHDFWEKEDKEKSKLTKAIKIIGNKNIKQISEWQKAHPEYNIPTSKENDKYMKLICNAMSGSTKEESDKNYEKIIKNIAKETIIDKAS